MIDDGDGDSVTAGAALHHRFLRDGLRDLDGHDF
jgi:hypothetical protein